VVVGLRWRAFALPGEGTTEEICNAIRRELKAE
jgi:hypothetical protein